METQQGFYSTTVLITFATEVCEKGTYGNELFSTVLLGGGIKLSPVNTVDERTIIIPAQVIKPASANAA